MKLSPQEMIVLVYIAIGYDDKEVAEKMKLSYYTVRSYIGRAMLKLAAKSKTNAVLKCYTTYQEEFMRISRKIKEGL